MNQPLPTTLEARTILTDLLAAWVEDLLPIRPGLDVILAESDLDDVYAPIWHRFESPEAAALARAFAQTLARNNARLLAELAANRTG